jgi:NAD-dependent SIR2 family protein deacetylase
MNKRRNPPRGPSAAVSVHNSIDFAARDASLDHIAQKLNSWLKSPRSCFSRVIFQLGAGISVAAGIPAFRLAGGMYDTLLRYLLPRLTATKKQRKQIRKDPTHVVSLKLFEQNQLAHLEMRRLLILGVAERRWKPTLAHRFLQMLHEKGVLHVSLPHCVL